MSDHYHFFVEMVVSRDEGQKREIKHFIIYCIFKKTHVAEIK